MKAIVHLCYKSEFVNAIRVDHTVFFDYNKFLNTMYKEFPTGGVLKYQIFMAEANNNSKLCKILCHLLALPDAEENAVVTRKGCSESIKNTDDFLTIDGKKILRSNYIKTQKPELLYNTAPGLKPRKEIGLFTQ